MYAKKNNRYILYAEYSTYMYIIAELFQIRTCKFDTFQSIYIF